MTTAEDSNAYAEILSRLATLQKSSDANGPPEKIPLIDPTANVLSLVGAAMMRQDDLRAAEARRIDDLRATSERYQRDVSAIKEQGARDREAAESRRIDALNLAESRRLDAVLAEQKSAVALASERTSAQAATLAAQVVTSAEALRAQVAAVATTTGDRIARLEQSQYAIGGRDLQRDASRTQTNISFSQALTLLGLAAGAIYFILNNRPPV